jgi:hypothetical protein
MQRNSSLFDCPQSLVLWLESAGTNIWAGFMHLQVFIFEHTATIHKLVDKFGKGSHQERKPITIGLVYIDNLSATQHNGRKLIIDELPRLFI